MSTGLSSSTRPEPLREALQAQGPALGSAARLSALTGLLLLVPSWYMLEVYGRVLNSRSLGTLTWLVVMVLGVYIMVELLDLVRQRVLRHAAAAFEARLRGRLFDAAFAANLRRQPGGQVQSFNDLRALREFGSSPVITALMDLPVALICLVLLFLMGPLLGTVALVTALVQGWLIWITERRSMPLLMQASGAWIQAQNDATGVLRNTQVIAALGMLERVQARWQTRQQRYLLRQAQASDHAGTTASIAKLLQLMQASVLIGMGAWIALGGGLWGGVGMVMVASIFGGRALQPLAQLVQQWGAVIEARDAWGRLQQLLQSQPAAAPAMSLPPPQGPLTVESVFANAPGQPTPVLRNVSFSAAPGQLTLIIGPTAAGKSTLARLLVGVWPCAAGKVRLDGADVHAWRRDDLGPHIGYLPQEVALFDGTVAENVARFGHVDRASVRDALELVGIDEVVDALPAGMDTHIGEDGAAMSGGQRQRLGLARAVYRQPHLVVLDEPNSNLDQAGDQALLAVIRHLKTIGAAVIAISHRASLMPAADKVVLLRDGQVAAFGLRDEVLAGLAQAPADAAPNSKPPPALGAPAAVLGRP